MQQLSAILPHFPDNSLEMSGEDFRIVRRKLRLTQQEAADALGVHIRSLQRWESGELVPVVSWRALRDLAGEMGAAK